MPRIESAPQLNKQDEIRITRRNFILYSASAAASTMLGAGFTANALIAENERRIIKETAEKAFPISDDIAEKEERYQKIAERIAESAGTHKDLEAVEKALSAPEIPEIKTAHAEFKIAKGKQEKVIEEVTQSSGNFHIKDPRNTITAVSGALFVSIPTTLAAIIQKRHEKYLKNTIEIEENDPIRTFKEQKI